MIEAEGEVGYPQNRFKPPSNFLLTIPVRHFCCGSYFFIIIFIVLRVAWLCGHSKTVRIALCIVFCFVQASTVTTSLQQLLTLLSVWLNVLFCVSHFRSYYSLYLSYKRSWGRGWVPVKPVKAPQYFYTDRSKAVLLLWFLTVTCSCCPYLYFGSAIMLVTYFVNLGSWMTTYLGKSCSFGLPRVPFVNCRQFMYLVISLLVLRAGCGIWLYQFLIIAYLFTLTEYSSNFDWILIQPWLNSHLH